MPNRQQGDYCQGCLDRYSPEDWQEWQSWRNRKPICAYCGEAIEWATYCHIKDGRTKFCSRQCSVLADTKIPKSAWPEIVRLYRDEKMTAKQIGERYSCTAVPVLRVLRQFDVVRLGARPGTENVMYGQTHTPEAKEKIRAANLRQFSSEENRRRHAELTAKQIQDGRTGKSFNRLETAFARILDSDGIRYVWQYRLSRYVFDFLLVGTNTLVETHGSFWHADPRFYDRDNLRTAQKINLANDARKEAAARAAGFHYACFWEHDIHTDPDGVRLKLQALEQCASVIL